MNKHTVAVLSMITASFVPALAHADSKAGMLVDITGASQANLAPYSEIASGTSIALGSSGSVKFVHYETCREVTITGGTALINEADYKSTGGTVSETQQACPERVHLAATTAVSGGLVMRGVAKMTEIGTNPMLVVAGKRATVVSSVVFIADDQSTTEGSLKDGHVTLADGASLKAGARYDLVLRGNGKTQLQMPVRVAANASPLLVLNVD